LAATFSINCCFVILFEFSGLWAQACSALLIAPIIPTPCQPGFQGIPILPGARPRTRRWPVLVFPGRSLGLGYTPRYVGGRKRLETKRSTGSTRGHGDLVTIAA
jgi:hypothetical protein